LRPNENYVLIFGEVDMSENSLYRHGQTYDAMNDRLVADTHFYIEEFKSLDGEILELACGTGRITCAIAKAGKAITGLDLSESMLSEAKQKSKKLNLNIEWVHGDMAQFELNKKFDAIFVGYNSVHHILTYQKFENLLACVKKHLKPGGRFLFDIFNPSIDFLARPKVRTEMDDYIDPNTGQQIFVTEDNRYDSATQINHVTYYYSKEGHPDFHSHPLDMRCYFPQEMDALLHYNEFKIIQKYGGFDKSSFSSKSMKQVFDCTVVKT
jgi:ubiquinone/menaquinone biosynthesis C-methylase UbiE